MPLVGLFVPRTCRDAGSARWGADAPDRASAPQPPRLTRRHASLSPRILVGAWLAPKVLLLKDERTRGGMPMRVKDAMTTAPVTIEASTPLRTAISIMRLKGVRHLPVVEDGALVGIITDRDLRSMAIGSALADRLPDEAQGRLRDLSGQLGELWARDAMTWAVVTTQPEAPLRSAALIMHERRVGSLPVVESGKLVGILTERDILRALQCDEPLAEYNDEGCL